MVKIKKLHSALWFQCGWAKQTGPKIPGLRFHAIQTRTRQYLHLLYWCQY
jgi:hypothetical protein